VGTSLPITTGLKGGQRSIGRLFAVTVSQRELVRNEAFHEEAASSLKMEAMGRGGGSKSKGKRWPNGRVGKEKAQDCKNTYQIAALRFYNQSVPYVLHLKKGCYGAFIEELSGQSPRTIGKENFMPVRTEKRKRSYTKKQKRKESRSLMYCHN